MQDTPVTPEEALEREHVQSVRGRIRDELHESTDRLQAQYDEMRQAKQYLQAGKGSCFQYVLRSRTRACRIRSS